MATVLPAQAALNSKLNRSRPTQKERKLIRQQQQQQQQHLDAAAEDALEHRDDALQTDAQATAATSVGPQLDWLTLTDAATYRTVPVVFTPDAAYCFIASGAAVRIYSVRSTELVSTLSIPHTTPGEGASSKKSRTTVTAVLLSPSNPRQLVVGASDGRLRIWDYVDGTLLRTLELGAAVVHATASSNLPDQVFVALASAPIEVPSTTAGSGKGKAASSASAAAGEDVLAGVYVVSLRAARSAVLGAAAAPTASSSSSNAAVAAPASPSTPVPPARRVRLAVPRQVRALALSPSGSTLASLTPTHVHLCQTAQLHRGFTKSVEAPAGESVRGGGAGGGGGDRMTTIAFHPNENVFATGNEKGQIRIWYNVLPRPASSETPDVDNMDNDNDDEPTTSVLHWHAHAVSSLAFTPNGAYLLSGGREAVLVLWQLHSGHQEYVPRLGAEIETLTVLESSAADGGEQQVAARLRDGSTVFVGSQRLKVVKTIAGLKSDLSSSASSNRAGVPTMAQRGPDLPVPLAVDPATSALVLPSGHPSSLQFYSPSSDAQLLELEISPPNRVASANGQVEPTRVERVAFSQPETGTGARKGEYWMATVDSWSKEGFASVRQLKFWRKREGQHGFILSTRIDRPHDAPITSIAFSPSTVSPLLLTTSTDGQIKVWGPSSSSSSSSSSEATWQCRASLSYRSSAPVASAWSHDGSLFAVAHAKRTVTLWSVANAGQLVHAFPATAIGRPKSVCFADREGTKVMCAGSSGAVCWDLLTLEETFSTSIEFAALVPKPRSSTLIGIEDAPSSAASSTSTDGQHAAALLYVFDPSAPVASPARKPKTRPLPHPVRQALWLPSLVAGEEDVSIAVTAADGTGSVALVGSAARSSVAAGAGAASRLPMATEGTTRLFDEIFGEADLAAASSSTTARKTSASSSRAADRTSQAKSKSGGGILDSTDGEGAPAHTLPPVRMLWREVFRDAFAVRTDGAGGSGGNSATGDLSASIANGTDVSERATPTATGSAERSDAAVNWSLGDSDAVRRIFSARLGL
ncbi:hypothetical protein JCM3774_006741 [Rhodotorula dairenensis]